MGRTVGMKALIFQLMLAAAVGIPSGLWSERMPSLPVSADTLAPRPETPTWTVLHVVHADGWSGAPVIDHLLTAEHPDRVQHVVLFFGRDEILTERLRSRGVRVLAGRGRGPVLAGLFVVSPDGDVVAARRYRSPLGGAPTD